MSKPDVKAHDQFLLPPALVSKMDISRLVSEVERVDSGMNAESVRSKSGSHKSADISMSDQLTSFLNENKIILEDSRSRSELIKQLRLLKDSVPVIHMTFAVAADRDSLQKLAKWARDSVHPQAVIAVGLQPSLVAGVYVRTPNHVHDFSLRGMLNGKHESLVKELGVLRGSS